MLTTRLILIIAFHWSIHYVFTTFYQLLFASFRHLEFFSVTEGEVPVPSCTLRSFLWLNLFLLATVFDYVFHFLRFDYVALGWLGNDPSHVAHRRARRWGFDNCVDTVRVNNIVHKILLLLVVDLTYMVPSKSTAAWFEGGVVQGPRSMVLLHIYGLRAVLEHEWRVPVTGRRVVKHLMHVDIENVVRLSLVLLLLGSHFYLGINYY